MGMAPTFCHVQISLADIQCNTISFKTNVGISFLIKFGVKMLYLILKGTTKYIFLIYKHYILSWILPLITNGHAIPIKLVDIKIAARPSQYISWSWSSLFFFSASNPFHSKDTLNHTSLFILINCMLLVTQSMPQPSLLMSIPKWPQWTYH